jgi:hypothetical protein
MWPSKTSQLPSMSEPSISWTRIFISAEHAKSYVNQSLHWAWLVTQTP